MKQISQIYILVLSLGLFAAGGCAKYTMRGVRAEPVPPGSSVGLAVISHQNVSFFKSSKTDVRPVLEDYLIAALVGRGFQPRALRLDVLASAPLLRRLLAQGAYSNVSDLRIDINKNRIEDNGDDADSPAETVPIATQVEGAPAAQSGIQESTEDNAGDAKVYRVDVEPRNEMTDALVRYDAMLELAASIEQKWELDYMVYVHRFSDYSYAAHVVRLADKSIVNTLIVSGNKRGLRRALGAPAAGSGLRAKRSRITHLEDMRFAEFFASKL